MMLNNVAVVAAPEGCWRIASFSVPAPRAVLPPRGRWGQRSWQGGQDNEPALATAPVRSRLPCPGVFPEELGRPGFPATRGTPTRSVPPVGAVRQRTLRGLCRRRVLLLPCRVCQSSTAPSPGCRLSSNSSVPRRTSVGHEPSSLRAPHSLRPHTRGHRLHTRRSEGNFVVPQNLFGHPAPRPGA